MTEGDITKLLYNTFSDKCIAVSQCKTGASFGGGYQIIDFWTINKSWANPLMIAYEIKVNRRDFLSDGKWMNYLNYCNEFYFITPINLIDKSEIPEHAGLKYVSRNGSRIYTKKKAPYRKIEYPVELFVYILMWRAKILKDEYPVQESKKEFWIKWMEEKKTNYELGCRVSKTLSKTIEEKIERQESINNRLRSENDKLKAIKDFLDKNNLGILNMDYDWDKEKLVNKIKEIKTGLNQDIFNYLDNSIKNLRLIKEVLNKEKKG